MRFSNKLTRTERSHFNSHTEERMRALEEKVVATGEDSVKEAKKKHVHATIFNGLVDSYFLGRANAKQPRNYKLSKKKEKKINGSK